MLPSLEIGGQEVLAARLAAALDSAAVEPVVLGLTGGGALESMLARHGVAFKVLAPKRGVPGWPSSLLGYLKANPVDVLHSHSGSWFPTAIAGACRGIPVLHAEHGRYPDEPGWVRWADRVASALTGRVVVVSEALQQEMHRRLGQGRRVELVPNGIQIPAPGSPTPTGLRASLGIPAGVPLIGTVGRLVEAKDHLNLIRALTGLSTPIWGVIVGEGPQREALEAELRNHSGGATIRLLGHRDDAADLAAQFDLYVSSSATEGTPIAVLEAMAAGRPIVATRVGGLGPLLAEGLAGVLVPPNDSAALGQAVAELLRSPQKQAALGAAARQRVTADYSMTACVSRYTMIYNELARR